jgi:two-component system, cell cycle sensor histidine kinase and response regulator CckA
MNNRKFRVLVMDDEDHIRDILCEMILELGYEVASAPDGSEAIQIFKENFNAGVPFDIVILDLIVKKGLGGRDTLKILREIKPDSKYIISSGLGDSTFIKYKEEGFDAKLSKPYSIDDVEKLLIDASKS